MQTDRTVSLAPPNFIWPAPFSPFLFQLLTCLLASPALRLGAWCGHCLFFHLCGNVCPLSPWLPISTSTTVSSLSPPHPCRCLDAPLPSPHSAFCISLPRCLCLSVSFAMPACHCSADLPPSSPLTFSLFFLPVFLCPAHRVTQEARGTPLKKSQGRASTCASPPGLQIRTWCWDPAVLLLGVLARMQPGSRVGSNLSQPLRRLVCCPPKASHTRDIAQHNRGWGMCLPLTLDSAA